MQVCIINSKALIEGSKIHNSKGGIGIVLLSSKATIKDCEVFENPQGGIYSNKLESDTQMAEAVLSNLEGLLSDKSELFKANEIEPEVEIENCNIHDTQGERWPQVSVFNSKLKISNSNVYNPDVYSSKKRTGISIFASPKAILYNCKIYQNGANGVNITNSSEVKMEYCDIYDNGSGFGDYPQISIEASEVFIENSEVWAKADSLKMSTGIYITASPKAILKNCKVYQNNVNGIHMKNSTYVKIEYCDIYDNGSSFDNYPQIWIEASEVLIENSQVWTKENSPKTSTGIYITGSPKITISNSKVFQNNRHGIEIRHSREVKIEGCDFYDNGASKFLFLKTYSQMYIEASVVTIENSKVWMQKKDIFNDGIYIKSGVVSLHKVSTWRHNGFGIHVERDAAFSCHECDIKEGIRR